MYSKLLDKSDDSAGLFSLLKKGAAKMREKLCVYGKDCLPGGIYWEPDANVRAILAELKPSNDFCESIFGLNDYLVGAIQFTFNS